MRNLEALATQGFSCVREMTYKISGDIGMAYYDISQYSDGRKIKGVVAMTPPLYDTLKP